MVREVTEKMNSDMFDGIQKASYKTEWFSHLQIEQAKESFIHNGYDVKIKEGSMTVKKN
jgi:hypothetical protein